MRILLKISGEALKGEKDFGIDPSCVQEVVSKIKNLKEKNIELAIVIGGGNIYRGSNLISAGVNSADSHSLSMLSTVFNGVVLKNFLNEAGIDAVVMDPNGINFVETYNKNIAKKYLEEKKIVICTGGTGNPYFTTDTGGVLRALELGCEVIVKATKVDGVYDKDPIKHNNAKFFEKISYNQFIEKDLKIMDTTAVVLAKENNLPIKVISLLKEKFLYEMIVDEKKGTVIN